VLSRLSLFHALCASLGTILRTPGGAAHPHGDRGGAGSISKPTFHQGGAG